MLILTNSYSLLLTQTMVFWSKTLGRKVEGLSLFTNGVIMGRMRRLHTKAALHNSMLDIHCSSIILHNAIPTISYNPATSQGLGNLFHPLLVLCFRLSFLATHLPIWPYLSWLHHLLYSGRGSIQSPHTETSVVPPDRILICSKCLLQGRIESIFRGDEMASMSI
jgi:hypothetical protein